MKYLSDRVIAEKTDEGAWVLFDKQDNKFIYPCFDFKFSYLEESIKLNEETGVYGRWYLVKEECGLTYSFSLSLAFTYKNLFEFNKLRFPLLDNGNEICYNSFNTLKDALEGKTFRLYKNKKKAYWLGFSISSNIIIDKLFEMKDS